MDDALLPDDDLDLALARAVERGVATADPLVAPLNTLRIPASVSEVRSAALWARIEAQTRPVPVREDRAATPRARRRVRWGTAGAFASLALLVAVAVFTLRPSRTIDQHRYTAAPGAAVQNVRLPDGSRVTLRPGSSLVQTAAAKNYVRYHLTGEALFDVAHDPARRFEVATPGGTVAVLGTRFRVAQMGDSTVVTLTRGRVALTSAAGARVVLAPGEEATVSRLGITTPTPADAEAAMDWTVGRLTFRQAAAAAVAAELEQHYNIAVEMPAEVQAETVSGSLALGTKSETLAALGRVLGGRFEAGADGVYRFAR